MQSLYTTNVGTIVLRAYFDRFVRDYVCTSLSMNIPLNDLPAASVVIGCGSSLRDGATNAANNSAEDLLGEVNDRIKDNTNFIDCAIFEVQDSKEILIFKGCIIAASLVYKTGSYTVRAVRLECMNSACKLYCQPFSVYNNRCAADIVNRILGQKVAQTGNEAASSYGMSRVSTLDYTHICHELQNRINNQDIATKFSYLADALAILTTRTINKGDPLTEANLGTILKIGDYVTSTYKLNYKALAVNDQTDISFNRALCQQMMIGLEQGSIMDTMIQLLTSPQYMLTLVPGWSDTDFKMQIKPSLAWDSSVSYTVRFDDIAELNSSYNPLEHINDPEVFVVNYSPAVEFDKQTGTAGSYDSIVGAYSTNTRMAEWIKLRWSQSDIEYPKRVEIVNDMVNMKWREYNAPTWLRTSIVRERTGAQGQPTNITDQRTWDKENDPDNKDNPVVYDYSFGENLADLIAQALYVHIHGEAAKAQVTLLPDTRFGLLNGFALEQHIGELIDILPSEKDDTQLAIRGMLSGIQFEYSAGRSANCRYSMTLSRVRPYDPNEKSIICPLYVKSSSK